ncbi:MAG TPA: hypothetical protein VFS40_07975 [Gemmatimonadales bacterium]|nr:hypothetical protein [Gemmatimonadales bacterium]
MSRRRLVSGVLVAALGLTACRGMFSPLRRKAEPGRDPYAVFAAQGEDGRSELYALLPKSGEILPMTFTPVRESAPALAPDGGMLAFVRTSSAHDTVPGELWVMNLVSGAERQLALPAGSASLGRVAWRPDGRVLYVETRRGLLALDPPPQPPAPRPVPEAERAVAESAFAVLLGEPAFARVERCRDEPGLCVVSAQGTERLTAEGHDAARWSADSVAWFEGDKLVVRPLAGGRERQFEPKDAPKAPRGLTYFPGTL